ncbi:MAG TPA: GTP-binding protein [Burkholderiales bacterium]|nr:GTP-binding protein [Burkholderiales bacterium]
MASESTIAAGNPIPVNVITGFLGSGKTTLLQRLLRSPGMSRTVVLINELGEIGLDHLLVERVDEALVLLQNGCICCSIRDDLKSALRGLLSREREQIPAFDRVVIETTGLADPGPVLYTLLGEPVVRHSFRLGNVVTTVDALNADLHLSRNPEGVKQVAAADRLVITKTDLADPARIAAVRDVLSRTNPSAEILDAAQIGVDADRVLVEQTRDLAPLTRFRPHVGEPAAADSAQGLQHNASVASLSLALDEPLDWTAFGIWLSLLLHRHGDNVLRVKGILRVQDAAAPVFINAVQHIVHPPQHLERWPTADHRSRIVFITRGIDHALLARSLAAFSSNRVDAPTPEEA